MVLPAPPLLRRGLAALGLAVVISWVMPASPAGAHAVLQGTSPAAESVLQASPGRIQLTFDEAVSLPDDAVRVLDVNGRRVDLHDAKAVDDVVSVTVPRELHDGSYVVAWKVISADAHPVSGAFTFAIGAPSRSRSGATAEQVAGASTARSRGPQTSVDITSALAYLGLLVCTGAAWFTLRLLPRPDDPAKPRLVRLVAASAAVGILGLGLLVPAEAALREGTFTAGLRPTALRHEVTGTVGQQAALGVIGLVLLVIATRAHARRAGSPVAAAMAAVGTVLALTAPVIVGHTRTFGPTPLVVASDLAHLGAAAIWAGGIAALLVCLRNPWGGSENRNDRYAQLVAGFSRWASISVFVVLAAGLILGWRIVGTLHALFTTTYGVVLLAKVGLFSIVAALGAYNHFVLVGRVEAEDDHTTARTALQRTMAGELVLIVAIVVLTGVLTSLSPHAHPANAASGTAAATEDMSGMDMPGMDTSPDTIPTGAGGSDTFGTGRATITVSPATTGTNTIGIVLTTADGDRLDLASPPTVELRLRSHDIGPITIKAQRTAPGSYRAKADFVLSGTWEINVSGIVSDFEQPQAIVRVPIAS